MCRYRLALFMLLMGTGTLRNPHKKNDDIQAAAISVSNKSSFTFDLGVSHLLPATMKLQQANILA